MRITVQLLGSILIASACQSFDATPVEAPVVEGTAASKSAVDPLAAPPSHANELELKFAKLWARVDELENLHIQQKERLKLIEKGLLLGIIPDELKSPSKKAKPSLSLEAKDEIDEDATAAKDQKKTQETANPKSDPSEKSQDLTAYKQLLQAAQGKFNAAQYGQAIVHFNEIGERFDASLTEGSQNYWIGLSWYYLKEYQLAEQSFKLLREKHPENSWVAHARYYQAKIDQTRGLNKRALEQFSQLMEEFASQDLGEMARMEVARMREKL